MSFLSSEKSIEELLLNLEKLPGIGPKSATRIAYFLLNETNGTSISLADAIREVKENVHFCKLCFNYSRDDLCEICGNESRDKSIICVVPEPRNIPPIERTGAFRGIYHVLGGVIAPLDGIGPDDLRINELIERARSDSPNEVIIAMDPNIEGDATSNYLCNLLSTTGVKVTRLARGIPFGGELEFADEMTLAQAFDDRRSF